MPTSEVIREFRSKVKRGELDDLQVVYRVSGGMPSEGRLNEEVRLAGVNKASARSAALPGEAGETREATAQLEADQVQTLYEQVGASLEGMVPRRKARFLPDTVIGSITLKVAGAETTLFFDADERAEQPVERGLAPGEADAITSLELLKRNLLGRKEE